MSPRPSSEDFYGRPEKEQIDALAELGREAIGRWKPDDAQLTPIAYRENMTFRVDAADRSAFALRIHQAGYRSDDEIRSELAFMEALRERGIGTPEVVPARDGSLFVVAESQHVPEPRQCDLFEWIDAPPLRGAGQDGERGPEELARAYRELGRHAGAIANAAEAWSRPPGFTRPVWDAAGIFGPGAHLGDPLGLAGASAAQRRLLERLIERLGADLAAFGRAPDRWGLTHGDFLPENILVREGGIHLIDFDDCGEGWFLFDFATALFDLLGQPSFDACLYALVEGFREHRGLPDDHLAQLPGLILARTVSYLGWCASRSHLDKASQIAPLLMAAIEGLAPPYLEQGGG